jgi:hypothetical protein
MKQITSQASGFEGEGFEDGLKPPPSVSHAVFSASVFGSMGGLGGGLGVYWQVHVGGRLCLKLPPICWHAPCPALPNDGGLPWAPSLTQSPWLATCRPHSGRASSIRLAGRP